jgi:hypothetical protein
MVTRSGHMTRMFDRLRGRNAVRTTVADGSSPPDPATSAAPAPTPRWIRKKAYMSPASAATIMGGIAAVILYFFECWIDGHFTKNMLAAGVFVAMMREIGAVWWAGGEQAPVDPGAIGQTRNTTLLTAAQVVREHPSDSREDVAQFIQDLAKPEEQTAIR